MVLILILQGVRVFFWSLKSLMHWACSTCAILLHSFGTQQAALTFALD